MSGAGAEAVPHGAAGPVLLRAVALAIGPARPLAWVRAVALSRAGAGAVSGGVDGLVRGWDLAHGTPGPVLAGHTGAVNGVAVSGDGRWAVSGGADGTVRVWDLRRGTPGPVRTRHRGAVYAVALSADGGRVVSGGGDGTVRVWDLAHAARGGGRSGRGRLGPVLHEHRGAVLGVAVSSDGRWAVSGGRTARCACGTWARGGRARS